MSPTVDTHAPLCHQHTKTATNKPTCCSVRCFSLSAFRTDCSFFLRAASDFFHASSCLLVTPFEPFPAAGGVAAVAAAAVAAPPNPATFSPFIKRGREEDGPAIFSAFKAGREDAGPAIFSPLADGLRWDDAAAAAPPLDDALAAAPTSPEPAPSRRCCSGLPLLPVGIWRSLMLLPAKTAGLIDSITGEEQQRGTERRPIWGEVRVVRVGWRRVRERGPIWGNFESNGLEESERGPQLLSASSSRNQRYALPEIGRRQLASGRLTCRWISGVWWRGLVGYEQHHRTNHAGYRGGALAFGYVARYNVRRQQRMQVLERC